MLPLSFLRAKLQPNRQAADAVVEPAAEEGHFFVPVDYYSLSASAAAAVVFDSDFAH